MAIRNLVLVLLVLSAGGYGCKRGLSHRSSDPTSARGGGMLGGEFYLSAEEVDQLSRLATSGDSNAAMRLHQYYGSVRMDGKESLRWLRVWAKGGDPIALYTLGFYYLEHDQLRPGSEDEGLRLMKRAADAGDASAVRYLRKREEIRRKKSDAQGKVPDAGLP
jgi:TPR repeat protein